MIRILGLGGVPGTGKSTLVQAVIRDLGPAKPVKGGRVSGTVYPNSRVFILGTYAPGERYPGTDRLSMSAQPDVVALLNAMNTDPNFHGWTVLFEGDRLFNGKLIDECRRIAPGSAFVLLTASEAALGQRRQERGDTMASTFVEGRKTKYGNLAAKCDRWVNETPEDQSRNHARLLEMMR